jgi:lipopolysaccharide transport system ATP-binding protein
VLEHATRTFSIRADQARTLRGTLHSLGRSRGRGGDPRLARTSARVTALRDVSLRIAPGETVGMVGRNGAGKTSTLRALAGIVPLQSGSACCGGRVVSLLELAAGFSRDFSGRENIYLQGALFGFQRAEIERRIEQIIAFSELSEEFIAAPVRTYSQGMFLRLGFSIAAHLDADVMLIDEVLAVGDEAFQRKCLQRISEQIAAGTTLLLVSHELAAIERVCERVIVLDAGAVSFDGPTTEGLAHYRRMLGIQHGGGALLRPARAQDPRIVELELRDGAGRLSSVFAGGEAMEVLISLAPGAGAGAGVGTDANVDAQLRLRIELRTAGETVLSASEVSLAPSVASSRTVRFEVAQLPLLGGDYELLAGVGRGAQTPQLQRSVRFAVTRGPDEGREGVIDLGGRWEEVAPAEQALGR